MADEVGSRGGRGTTVRRGPADIWATIVGTLANVVRWAGLLVMTVLVARVLLTVGGANPANGITSVVTAWSDRLAWVFRDLFTPGDTRLRILVNYGIAALFWLIASVVVARIVRSLGR